MPADAAGKGPERTFFDALAEGRFVLQHWRRGAALLFASALCLQLGAAPAAPADGGGADSEWEIARSPGEAARLREAGAAPGALETAFGKFLVLRCAGGRVEAAIQWGHFGSLGYAGPGSAVSVTVRFDSGPEEAGAWRKSRDHNMSIPPDPEAFARRLAAHRRLAARGPELDGGAFIADFDLRGAGPVVREAVARCAGAAGG